MIKFIYFFVFLCFCFSCVGLIPVKIGSDEHKATILYFEGGSGKIKSIGDWGAETKLICRTAHYFPSAGIKLEYIPFNLNYQHQRVSIEHFNIIQKRVNKLRANGHNNIWLMGISNGAISVSNAGERQIKGVEGLIAINPGAGGRLSNYKRIFLPVLLITHELDGGMKGFTAEEFKRRCPKSVRAKNSIFRGGVTGTSREATGSTQKYQHGLRGLEKQFVEVVVNFITTTPYNANSALRPPKVIESFNVNKDKRFIKNESGVVYDKLTGLEWVVGPDRDMSWNTANSWAKNLKISGKSWRLPSPYELTDLYTLDSDGNKKAPSLMEDYQWIWSDDIQNIFATCVMFFGDGGLTRNEMDNSNSRRAFAVRTRE